MAKIKIHKLPTEFKLVKGEIVEENLMMHGGMVNTGDQADYGLVTTPQEYYSNTNFNNTDDKDVRYSLSSVPRDRANIEAEGGETVLTDLTNDGQFGLYDIKGPRHSAGGVPMFLPEQSFIYSDTDKMKFTKDELADFGINTKKKMTPAKLSKKYELNDYYAHLESPYADKIQAVTSELMLKKNMMNLSKVAFGQEAKKKFEEGVPLASHPYLVQQGIDPLEFTAKMEAITREEAQMRMIASLPPEQQEQMMMLQQMMEQVDQQQPQSEGVVEESVVVDNMSEFQKGGEKASEYFNKEGGRFTGPANAGGPAWPSAIEDPIYNADTKLWEFSGGGDSLSSDDLITLAVSYEQGIIKEDSPYMVTATETESQGNTPVATGVEVVNPLKKDHPKYNEWGTKLKTGNYTITTTILDDGSTQYDLIESIESFNPSQISSAGNQVGTGEVAIYDETTKGQQEILNEANSKGYQYLAGMYSKGNRPSLQSSVGEGTAYGSGDIITEEAKADFMNRWGDITSQIEGFDYFAGKDDPQWGKLQKLQEETRKKEHLNIFGNLKSYQSYYNDDVAGSGFDSRFGLHTFNTPRLKKVTPSIDTVTVKGEDKGGDDITQGTPIEYRAPKAEWWKQDQNNLTALGLLDDNLYLPFQPDVERTTLTPTFDDWRGAVNANNASASTIANALGAVGGPQAVANSNIQGKNLAANAKAIAATNSRNVGVANQFASMQGQLDAQFNQLDANRKVKVYDDTNKTLQAADNFRNWRTNQNAKLQNAALTNRANTFNLNTTYDNYAVDPRTGGMIDITNTNALNKVGLNEDPMDNFIKQVQDYETKVGKPMPDALIKYLYPGQKGNSMSSKNNLQSELRENGQPYIPASKGKEIKRMAVPFYTGKMGG